MLQLRRRHPKSSWPPDRTEFFDRDFYLKIDTNRHLRHTSCKRRRGSRERIDVTSSRITAFAGFDPAEGLHG
jgi:hypothetical protein